MTKPRRGLARRLGVALALVALLAGGPALAVEAVDLNQATEAELIELPGIGPVKAKRIIEYRAENPFRSADELLNVPGVGPATYRNLEDRITVGSVGEKAP